MDENPFNDPSVQRTEELPSWIDNGGASNFLAPAPAQSYEASSWGGALESGGYGGGQQDEASGWSEPTQSQAWSEPSYAAAPPPLPTSSYGPAQPAYGQQQPQQQQPNGGVTKDNLVTYMRLLNMGITILMSMAAVYRLLDFPGFNSAILSMYIWFFAALLCCFETHLKMVSKIIASNFGFLYHVKGRVAFLLLMAMLCFGLKTIGVIAGCGCIFAAGFNAYVISKHPEYEQSMKREDMEQKGAATVSGGLYSAGVDPFVGGGGGSYGGSGATWAASNPQAAQGAFQFAADNPELARNAAAHATGNNAYI